MTNLETIKANLKRAILESLDQAFKMLEEKLLPGSDNFNEFIQINGRYRNLLREVVAGTLDAKAVDVVRNQIIQSLLIFIDSLDGDDLRADATPAPAAEKRGEVLYRIPDEMQVGKESKCTIRVAWLREVLLRDWEQKDIDVIKNIRVADIMGVYLINADENNPFAIRTLSEPIQFLDKEDFTEWIFYVKPLMTGEHPLVLRVSVIELINGKEYKKDIVLEEHVVVVAEAPKPQASKDFSRMEEPLVIGGEAVEATQSRSAAGAPSPQAKRGLGSMAGTALSVLALAIIGIVVGVQPWKEDPYEHARKKHSIEAYRKYLSENPDGKHRDEAIAALQVLEQALADSIARNTPFVPAPDSALIQIPEKAPATDSPSTSSPTDGSNPQITDNQPKPGGKKKPSTTPKTPGTSTRPTGTTSVTPPAAGPQPPPETTSPTEVPPPAPGQNAELKGKVFYFKIPTFQIYQKDKQQLDFLFYKYNEDHEIRVILYSNGSQRLSVGDEVSLVLANGQSIQKPLLYVGSFPDRPKLTGGYFGLNINDLQVLSKEKVNTVRVAARASGQVNSFNIGRRESKEFLRVAQKAVEKM